MDTPGGLLPTAGLPLPVAEACEAAAAASGADRVGRLDALTRVLARTLLAILLAEYLRGRPDPEVERLIAGLDQPSGAHWAGLLRRLVAGLNGRVEPPPCIDGLLAWLAAPEVAFDLDRALAALDDGASVSESASAPEPLIRLVAGLRGLSGCRLVHVEEATPTRRRTFRGRLAVLARGESATGAIRGEWSAFLVPEAVYLLDPSGDALLDLTPFIRLVTVEPARRLYLFQALSADRERLILRDDAEDRQVERGASGDDGEDEAFAVWIGRRAERSVAQASGQRRATLAHQPNVALVPGGVVAARYEVRGLLGEGGMARVYRAWDRVAEEEVALKVLRRGPAKDPALLERFRREARTMTRLNHPQVLRVRSTGDLEDGTPFLTLPLLEGGSLAAPIPARSHPEEQVRSYADQALGALAYLHGRGIVHRDVKPTNLLLDRAGNVHLADFGVAWTPDDLRLTRPLHLVGSLGYMAPEQRRGDDPTPAMDLYALAVTLHEVLTGAAPTGRPGRGLPAPLGPLLQALAAEEPSERPDAAEALRRLRQADGTDGTDGPDTGTMAAPAGRNARLGPHALEPLGRAVEAVSALTAATTLPLGAVIDRVSSFVAEAARLIGALGSALAHPGAAGSVVVLGVSVSHLAHELLARLQEARPRPEEAAELAGLRTPIQQRVLAPAEQLLARARELGDQPGDRETAFAALRDPLPATPAAGAAGGFAGLLQPDELRCHDAVVACAKASEAFLERLQQLDGHERDAWLEALWRRADVLLMEGGARARALFEAAVELAGDDALQRRWRHLHALFRGRREAYWEAELVRLMIERYPPSDRRVFARALALHPHAPYRSLAFAWLEPGDFWELVSHPATPPERLLEVWRSLRRRVSPDFLKVFFVCAHDALGRPGGTPGSLLAAVELLKEFYTVNPFHEDTYFHLLLGLDEPVRAEGRRLGLRIDLDAEYVRLYRDFLAGGRRHPAGGEDWASVPLPVQRRLARRAHFLPRFACHPLDAIALECLPYFLAREDVTDLVRNPAINASLLRELAREARFYRREEARLALVSNPKTPGNVVAVHMARLARRSLEALTESHEANPAARSFAARMLEGRR